MPCPKCSDPAVGRVVAVRGAVLDVTFETAALPAIEDALRVEWDRTAPLSAEVQSLLDAHTVRAIALQDTAGLPRWLWVVSGSTVTNACSDSGVSRFDTGADRLRCTNALAITCR